MVSGTGATVVVVVEGSVVGLELVVTGMVGLSPEAWAARTANPMSVASRTRAMASL